MTTRSDGIAAVMEGALSRSAEALSTFLGDRLLRPTEIGLSRHKLVEIPALSGPEDTLVSAVVLEIDGDLEGYLLLATPFEQADVFLRSLLGDGPLDTDEQLAESALGEMGNVVGSTFLNYLADRFSMHVKPSPPAVVCDMVGALLSTLAGALAEEERPELPVVRANLGGDGHRFSAYLLWIPGRSDWERLEALA